MIYIVLRAPNGDGTFSPVLGLTTGDTAQTINGVLCVPGCIGKGSVSKLSDSMDISQAKGGVPQGIQWSFDLIDWTGAARRSAGLLNGGTRFVGWRAALYISRRGDNSTPSPVCGSADYFTINGCSSSDGVVQLKCIAAWALDATLVSFKSGTQSVGLVVGGHAVSVPTEALPEPVGITYTATTGWKEGSPNTPIVADAIREVATGKLVYAGDPMFLFSCISALECDSLIAKLEEADASGGFYVTGSKYAERGQTYFTRFDSGATLGIKSSQIFYDSEEFKSVSLRSAVVSGAIAAGTQSLLGFESDGRIVLPVGSTESSSTSPLAFTPTHLLQDGFAAFSVIPTHIAFDPAGVVPPNVSEVEYYNLTSDIWTDGREPGDYVLPARPNTSTHYSAWVTTAAANQAPGGLTMPFRIIPESLDLSGFTGFAVDVAGKFSIKNTNAEASVYFTLHEPFSSAASFSKEVDGQDGVNEYIHTYGPSPIGLWPQVNRFSSIDLANSSGTLSADRGAFSLHTYLQYEIQGITTYGESTLSFGSNYAQVQPGASPWWTAPVTPEEVVAALSGNVSGPVYPSIPGGPLRTPISWGEYISPDKTYMDAAVKLCEEFWITMSEASTSKGATGNELLTVPSIDMGSYTDVVTEPVIEYAPVGGAYTKKAYISSVDQAFDASRPGDFYGGWGKADDMDFGFEIWKICREAYKATGTKASETYQADGIHEEYHIGLEWMQRTRSGVNRISWLAYPPRYMTFSIMDDEAPSWWSGAQVNPPKSMAGFAGYNVPAGAFTVVAKEFYPMTCEASFTVALPPLVSTGTTNRIIQTANPANDRIVQSLTAVDKITQIIEA